MTSHPHIAHHSYKLVGISQTTPNQIDTTQMDNNIFHSQCYLERQ